MRARYSTKMSNITLAIGEEPEDWLNKRIKANFQPMQIYHELKRIAKANRLPMINQRTVYVWINKLKNGDS